MTTICKALVDDFGRVVGVCEVSRNHTGLVTFGRRNGCVLDVFGVAKIKPISRLGYTFAGVGEASDGHRYATVVGVKSGMSEAWRVYEVSN